MEKPANPPRIVASRSHRTPETDAVIDAVSAEFGQGEIVSSGSSLKLCQIAEGSAEFYPRCAPTMEWDTAAADAVCRAAGARVVQALNGADLEYGKNNLLNPWFIVGRGDALISCAVEAIRSTQDSSEA
jgi:3'(2'), 5'-bisphosphate nucleotidase